MTTGELKEQQTRVLPVPVRPATPAPAAEREDSPMDRVWREIGEALQMRKAGIALDAVGLRERQGEPINPWVTTIEMAKGIGLDLGEMNRQRSEELSQLRLTLADKDREVHEMRIKQLDEALARILETQKRQQEQPQEKPRGFLEQLDAALGNRLMTRIAERAFAEPAAAPAARTLGSLIEELADGLGEDPGELRRRLRGGDSSLKGQILDTQDSQLRLQLTKLLLETELEETKAKRAADVEEKKAEALGKLVDTVKENVPDFLEAIKSQVDQWNSRGKDRGRDIGRGGIEVAHSTGPEAGPQALGYICGACRKPFNVYERASRYHCPYCGEGLDIAPEPGADEAPASRK